MKKEPVRSVAVVSVLAIFLSIGSLCAGEAYQCARSVDAYDLKDPARQVGSFQPQTSLEIEEYVASAKMFRVLYKSPDGNEMRVLCKPADLGRKPPEETSGFGFKGATTRPEKDQPKAEGSTDSNANEPPLFGALQQFQPEIWETSSSKFALQQARFGFRWVSLTENNESRWAPLPGGSPVKFLGQPLYEALVRFKSDRPEEIRLFVFNRGDAKRDMDEGELNALLKTLEASLDEWMGGKGVDAWVPAASNVANAKCRSWFKAPLRTNLEWSFTRNAVERDAGGEVRKPFRTEFVRLVITPYDGKTDTAILIRPNYQAPPPTAARSKDVKGRVKRETGGDVYLEGVPMVDQGQKGYCVVAASERVLRYFGLDVDQNEIAKMANTSSAGTDPESMYDALNKTCRQFSLVVRKLINYDIQDFIKEVDAYNRVAKKNKKREITLPQSGMINLTAIWESMDLDCLREVRLKHANDKTRFVKEIAMAIDKGVPLLWSVEVGWVAETPALPQAHGGHMRLIIGYNEKGSEIIYSDTWGVGHEFKKMKVDDAFFITHGLYSVAPAS